MVDDISARIPWIPLPKFSFEIWLGLLIAEVIALVLLSRFVFQGAGWMRRQPLHRHYLFIVVTNFTESLNDRFRWKEMRNAPYQWQRRSNINQ